MHTAVVTIMGLSLVYAGIRLVATWGDNTDRKLSRLVEWGNPLLESPAVGRDYWLVVNVEGQQRLYRLVLPHRYKPGARLVVAADGVTFLNREGNMAVLADWANQHGFALAVLFPEKTRYAGLFSGWNIPDSLIRYLPWRGNDVAYASSVIALLRAKLKPRDIVGCGVGAGVDIFTALAEEDWDPLSPLPIDVIVSIDGTDVRRRKPRRGIRLLAFQGRCLPLEGGVGSNLLTWLLILLGNWGYLRSQPWRLVAAYRAANGLGFAKPILAEQRLAHRVRVWGYPEVRVVSIKISGPHRGHGMAALMEVVNPAEVLSEFFPQTAEPAV